MKLDTTDPRITFARVVITVDGSEILVKSISYGDGIQFSDVTGNAPMSLGTTDGAYAADEGTLDVYADEYAQILEKFGTEFYRKSFDISVAYEKDGSSKLTKDELIGCRWTKRGVNDQAGGDGLSRTLGFKPAYVKFQGQAPLKNMPTGAK